MNNLIHCLLEYLKKIPCRLYSNLWVGFFYMIMLGIVALFQWETDGSLTLGWSNFIASMRSAVLPALILMMIRCLCLVGRPPLWRRIIAALPTACVSIACISETWLSWMIHTRWSDRILRLMVDTSVGESSEFIERYLLSAKSIGVLLGMVLLTRILYVVLRRIGYYLRLSKVKKRRIFQFIGGIILFSTGLIWWSLPPENNFNSENNANTLKRLWKMREVYEHNKKRIKALERTPSLADGIIPDSITPPARIIWVIGESDSKAHWRLFGYFLPTTPHMQAELDAGNLLRFEDVISYEPRTYRMMETLFSPHVLTDSAKYYFRKPLTPMILRKAGYSVRLHDNQATLVKGDDQAEIGTCNFMNSIALSHANFNYRNERMYPYDIDLLKSASWMLHDTISQTIDIFHINGQHFSAVNRYPVGFGRFTSHDYATRKDLSFEEKQQIAEYDNATLYVDSFLAELIKQVKGQDAVIVYMPDHGEEMNDKRHCHVRTMDSHKLPESAPFVLEIPFIVYTTPEFRRIHPNLYLQLQNAASEKQSLIYFSHFLLDLAGVESKYKKPEFSPLSKKWSSPPRIVKDIGDYDVWKAKHSDSNQYEF